tara:strand:+ start:4625 stop:5305 length:681 start_codon:yes stop_codon:yes gene_type:complete
MNDNQEDELNVTVEDKKNFIKKLFNQTQKYYNSLNEKENLDSIEQIHKQKANHILSFNWLKTKSKHLKQFINGFYKDNPEDEVSPLFEKLAYEYEIEDYPEGNPLRNSLKSKWLNKGEPIHGSNNDIYTNFNLLIFEKLFGYEPFNIRYPPTKNPGDSMWTDYQLITEVLNKIKNDNKNNKTKPIGGRKRKSRRHRRRKSMKKSRKSRRRKSKKSRRRKTRRRRRK